MPREPANQNPYDHVACGLPENYWRLTRKQRWFKRKDVMTSWFDPKKLDIFCIDVDRMVQAARLWHEHYMRPARCNRGIYTLPNPDHKYTILKNAFLPPKEQGLSGKSITHAPRGTGKSITLVLEFVPFVTIVRPATEVVVSQINKPKTRDWLERIRACIEENDLIHEDFGGKGVLWGIKGKRRAWNSDKLQFSHDPQSRIVGVSANSAVRGAHPILAILDDPEDKEDARSQSFADKFFDWLLFDYLPIVQPGGYFNWITTINDENSCANVVINGVLAGGEADETRIEDERFNAFNKTVIEQYTRDEDTGEWSSCWEALRPVSAMAALQRSMQSAFDAELQGKPRPAGEAMFVRNDFEHGWAECVNADGQRFALDLCTGECIHWDDFLLSMAVFGGLDLADSQKSHAQPGAAIFFGVRNGIMYILDAFIRKTQCMGLVRQAMMMGVQWEATLIAVDSTAMQCVIVDVSQADRKKLIDEGHAVPRFSKCNSAAMANKVRRIEAALSTRFRDRTIRFRWMHGADHQRIEALMATHGLTGLSPFSRRGDHAELLSEVDRITDNARPKGWNALDAIEMGVRKARLTEGNQLPEKEHPNRKLINMAKELGLDLKPRMMPDGSVTPGFDKEDYEHLNGGRILTIEEADMEKVPEFYAVDPYD